MKKTFALLFLSFITGLLTQCGPAAEDRDKMHETANRISDSIGKAIDEAMAKGAIPNSVSKTDSVASSKK